MKKCPKCGASVDSSSKFCTNCGYSFMNNDQSQMNNQQNNTQDNINRNVENVKKYSNGYFSWFMKSIKKPSESIENTHTYYGLTSFIISAVLIAFSLYNTISSFVSVIKDYGIKEKFISEAADNLSAADSSLESSSGDSGKAFIPFMNRFVKFMNDSYKMNFLKALIFIIIIMIVWLAIGFFAKKLSSNNKLSIFNYLNKLAEYTNYIIIIEIFIALFSIVGNSYSNIMIIIVLLSLLIPLIYNIGLSFLISKDIKGKMDKLYVMPVAILIDLIIAYEIIKYFFN
ncbi:zinc ribbon domain-containing protein [Apilactobacillus micheneri]|uniref:zinc ribbon domain-containing protein n=1 Tax=Apilactobacillus micheneri TaxID=1899430 RepID=UPI0011286CB9|nr:zinc ribbon domain-containing protein [Apilactobacillus micheneri]TPR50396.1 zinc ribbon domain-containing protein [Apilactobacillus micheneri]